MIKKLIDRLFFSNKKQNQFMEDFDKNGANSDQIPEVILEKGELVSIFVPDLMNQKSLTLTKWHCKPGTIVKRGAVICDIESEKFTMEFETFYSGKILPTRQLNDKLTPGEELLKIEGV